MDEDHGPRGSTGTCAAPYTSMRFEPDGRVSVCCINGQYSLGRADRQTISEIWEGSALLRLRGALDHGDYSLGCIDCKHQHEAGRRSETQAAEFDRLVGPDLGEWPRRLEFALSNTCNLQCVMCNGELSSAIRASREHRQPLAHAYPDRFFDELTTYLPHVHEAAFLGGEPFLSNSAMRVWDLIEELGVRPAVHVTTNGTIMNERVERYVRRLRMDVAISIDAVTAATFESIRIGADHARIMTNLRAFRRIVADYGGALSVNSCFMVQNWHELPDLLLMAEELDVTVTMIPVVFPRQMSVLSLPPGELSVVRDALRQSDDRMTGSLRRNLATWTGALRRLDAALDADAGTRVMLTGAAADAAATTLLAPYLTDLEDTAGRSPAILDVVDDIITSVTAPGWAAPLALEDMVGESLLRFLPLLSERLDFAPSLQVEQIAAGVTRTRLSAIGPGWQFTITAIIGEWERPPSRRAQVAIVSADDLEMVRIPMTHAQHTERVR